MSKKMILKKLMALCDIIIILLGYSERCYMGGQFTTSIILLVLNIMIAVLYTCIWTLERKSFIKLWMYAAFYSVSSHILYFIIIFIGSNYIGNLLMILKCCFLIISSVYFIYGIFKLMNKNLKPNISIINTIIIASGIIMIIFRYTPRNFLQLYMNFVGIAIIVTSIVYSKTTIHKSLYKTYTKLSLMIFGIIVLLFNYAHSNYFSLISFCNTYTALQSVVYLNFLFLYFQNVKEELIEIKNKLQRNENKLRDIIENQKDVIFELDEYGKFTFVSDASRTILGYNSDELIGKNIKDIFQIDIETGIVRNEDNYIKMEVVFERQDKKSISLDITWKNIKGNLNKFKGAVGSIRDITDHKLLDEYIKTDRVKTENFTNLSHDLRTPLNVINSTLQVVDIYKKENIKDKGEKLDNYLDVIKKNVYRLIKLVNNIIDISKLDSGFYKLNCTYGNMVEVVEDTCMLAVDYAESKEINLQFDTTEEEMYSDFDEDKIERVVLNLLSNALRFTPRGGYIMVNMNRENENITISIKDSGIGIEQEKIELIFDKFTQLNKSNLRGTAGSGLGLSIVKSLIELHGGTIEVYSEINKGSNFIIRLPITNHNSGEKSALLTRSKENIKIELGDI